VDLTPGLRREAAPDLEAVGQEDELVERIHAEIAASGPMTFARFMELALYDPAGGYYRAATARPGRAGDFLTAPETHPLFGAALSRLVADAWERLGRPAPFTIREYGAGTGTLAVAILDRLELEAPALARVVRYDPVDVEPRRRDAVAARLAEGGRAGILVDAAEAAGAGTDAGAGSPVTGIVLANEVLDALPTHRVVQRDGRLLEVLVGSSEDRFVDDEAAPTTPALAARLEGDGIVLADGQHAEICLGLDAWIDEAAAGLARGLLVLIDYGYPATELYDPVRRGAGTLRAYLGHRVTDDPYRHVGRQDLTAHVDVTAVERAAVAAGLTHLRTTTQAELLVGLGMEDLLQAIQADPGTTLESYLAVRSSVMRLLDPAAMGRFRVMGFGRHWPADALPAGFGYRLR
jgi:SAM-dependent MidA family methyltransferase